MNDSIKVIQNRINTLIDLRTKMEEEIRNLEENIKDIKNIKNWQSMKGKYYHVEFYHTPKENRFKECEYCFIKNIEDKKVINQYIRIEESNNCFFMSIIKLNITQEPSYKKWTEITKKEYDKIITKYKPTDLREKNKIFLN